MTDNTLVAEDAGHDTFGGISDVANLISSDGWTERGIDALDVGLDAVDLVADPIGTLVGWGASWAIDHFNPMKGWLDDLAGNPSEVEAFSATWHNIATCLDKVATDVDNYVKNDLSEIEGLTDQAYKSLIDNTTSPAIRSISQSADAVSSGLERASGIVATVHGLVRDVISSIIGSLASSIIEAVCTVGTAIPGIVAQISKKVASWVAKLHPTIQKLIKAIGNLHKLLGALSENITNRFSNALFTFKPKGVDNFNASQIVHTGANAGRYAANDSEKAISIVFGYSVGGDINGAVDQTVRAGANSLSLPSGEPDPGRN